MCSPLEVKAGSISSPLSNPLVSGLQVSWCRFASGGHVSTQSGVLLGDCSSPLRHQDVTPGTSEGMALRAHRQEPQGQTARPIPLLSLDSSSRATVKAPSQCLAE